MTTQISAHFTEEEFHCKCTACAGKPLSPTVKKNIWDLVQNHLEPMRAKLGHPMHIDCGYRCTAHNKAVGGVAGSAHILGYAADWTSDGMTAEAMFEFAFGADHSKIPAAPKNFGLRGCGYYPKQGFCHVDIDPRSPRPNSWIK